MEFSSFSMLFTNALCNPFDQSNSTVYDVIETCTLLCLTFCFGKECVYQIDESKE